MDASVALASEGSVENADVVFIHASGFCKEVWRPVVESLRELRPAEESVALDLRGHGDSPTGHAPYRWDTMTQDVIATIGLNKQRVGVGHSVGGAIIARAAAAQPDLFSAIVLIEPIIAPPPYRRENIPLARAAQRRKAFFPSRTAAYDRFASDPMSTWQPAALAAYVDHGFASGPQGWTIKCAPGVEADVFREGNNHDTWDRVADIDIPTTIVSGALSETHRGPYLDMLRARFDDPSMISVRGAGHFLPMERPDVVGSIVADVVANASRG